MQRFPALLLALVLAGCASAPVRVDRASEEAALMQRSRDWSNAAATGNLDAILGYWADNAVIMPPGQPPVSGRAAIRRYVEATGNIPGFSIRWEPLAAHVSASGDMGYLIERNVITYRDSTGTLVTERNKVVTVWTKGADGVWRNVVDMWNADPMSR